MEEALSAVSSSPSLISFSAANDSTLFTGDGGPQSQHPEADEDGNDLYNDDEFAFVCGNPASPVPADEIFLNGQIKPTYQVFAGDTIFVDTQPPPPPWFDAGDSRRWKKYSNRPQLKALIMSADRKEAADSSCEAADELAPPPESTYCMWNPGDHTAAAATPPERCEKSNSTGSSSMWRWKLKELLLKRSNSVGTTGVVLVGAREKGGGGDEGIGGAVEYYVKQRNDRNMKMQRRKSFLPYRQDLFGFFTNVNGLSRNLHPF